MIKGLIKKLSSRFSANRAARKSKRASKKIDKKLLNKYISNKEKTGLLDTKVHSSTKQDRYSKYRPILKKMIKEGKLSEATKFVKDKREKFLGN